MCPCQRPRLAEDLLELRDELTAWHESAFWSLTLMLFAYILFASKEPDHADHAKAPEQRGAGVPGCL